MQETSQRRRSIAVSRKPTPPSTTPAATPLTLTWTGTEQEQEIKTVDKPGPALVQTSPECGAKAAAQREDSKTCECDTHGSSGLFCTVIGRLHVSADTVAKDRAVLFILYATALSHPVSTKLDTHTHMCVSDWSRSKPAALRCVFRCVFRHTPEHTHTCNHGTWQIHQVQMLS